MFIIAMRYSQLGNRLFLFAHIIACAIENNISVMNSSFFDYARFFETTHKDFFCRYPAKKSFFKVNKIIGRIFYRLIFLVSRIILVLQLTDEEFLNRYPSHKIFPKSNKATRNIFYRLILLVKRIIKNKGGFTRLKTIHLYSSHGTPEEFHLDSPSFVDSIKQKQTIFFLGWKFRDKTNIIKHADKIRAYFIPIKEHKHATSDLIADIRNSCEILVGVHIRQGDTKNPWTFSHKWNYETDTYIQIMERVERLFPDKRVGFLVCSDDKQDKNKFSKFNFAFGRGHIIEDMYSLAQCDYIIGPPSTYSGWASFYGKVPQCIVTDPEAPISLNSFNKSAWCEWI